MIQPKLYSMKTVSITAYLFVVLSFFTSCSSGDESNDSSNSNNEIAEAKSFYASNGGTFKFRLYNFVPTEGDHNNYNYHTAEIYKIIDDNGIFSTFAKYTVPSINLVSYGAVLNCQGDYNTTESTNKVGFQNASAFDDFEIDTNYTRLISYNSTSGSHGSYGFVGTRIYVHSPTFFSGAISASSNQGYMHTINHSNFMLSMGLNSNYGKPTFYQYIPTTYNWVGTVVPAMDYVQGSGVNIPTTNDASKVGNTDKVYWAWLSYTNTAANGKINIISYNGSSFSNVTSLDGIGSIGPNLSTYSINSITLYKNPDNLNNPYMVVRRYNSDIIDIYKFTGSAIEVVKTGVSLPSSITLLPGDTIRVIKDLVFSGNSVYLISGRDKNLYKLVGTNFEIIKPNLTVGDDRISALESTPGGVLVSIVKTIPSTPLTKIVSDVVYVAN
ncbi:MAG: hypothetical protein RLZZ500_1178 [Bacteroidota bacterium]